MRLEVGDLMLTRGMSRMSRLIRYFSRRPGEPRSRVNHAGVVVQPGDYDRLPRAALVVEAGHRVKLNPILPRTKTQVAIFRHRGLTYDMRQRVATEMYGYMDKPYGYATIAMHFLDWFLAGQYVFRRLTRNGINCSAITARSFAVVAVDFKVPPKSATPDDLWDYVRSRPEEWECILSEVE